MTIEELIRKLDDIKIRQAGGSDLEGDHWEADKLLLSYINNHEVSMAFGAIDMWYA